MKEIFQRLEDLDTLCGSLPFLKEAFSDAKKRQQNLEVLAKEMKEDICECLC